MKELRILVSPFYSEDVFVDPVTGLEYKKSEGVYGINLSEDKLTGIKEGLRKNFLIPFDRQTLDFIKANSLPSAPAAASVVEKPKEETPIVEPKIKEAPAEEPKEEVAEEAPVAKKATRKRAPKKNVSEE